MGHNMPCDLHNEHVNKLLKDVICHMGANFSQKALTSAARSVTYMSSAVTNFDQQCGITPESTAHHTKDDVYDVKRIMEVVRHQELWKVKQGRKHCCFKTLSSNPLINLDRKKFKDWMQKKIIEYRKYKHIEDTLDAEPNDSDFSNSDMSDTETL